MPSLARSAFTRGRRGLLASRLTVGRLPVLALLALATLAFAKGVLAFKAANDRYGTTLQAPQVPTGPGPSIGQELMAEPAAGPEDEEAPGEPTALAEGSPASDGDVRQDFSQGTFTPSELEQLSRLVERRRTLEEREHELDLRAALLKDAEARLSARAAELEALRTHVVAMLEQHGEAEEAKLARLVKIYESMKPKAAAEIFDRLEMKVLVSVVSRMREGVASEVMGRMNPERAEELTAELARRRRLEPLDLPAGTGSTG